MKYPKAPLVAGLCGLLLWLAAPMAQAQSIVRQDTSIANMVNQISAQRMEQTVRKLVSFGTRHSRSDTKSNKRGIGAARRWVKATMEEYAQASNGRMTVALDFYTVEADGRRIPETIEMANVVATLKGTDPNDDRVFLISGHLDSRATDVMKPDQDSPGANDDASGVAMVMELARIMCTREFPATIKFMAVTGEEQGLYGATHMAKKAKEQGWNLVAMLNNDMISNAESSGTNILDNTRVRVFSEGVPAAETETQARMRRYTGAENDSPSRQLARYIKEMCQRYVHQLEVKLIYRNDRYLRGGDHTPFAREGFTAVRVCEMNENYKYQHQDVRVEDGVQYGDLPEFQNYEYLRKVSGLNLATLANLSLAPGAPQETGVDISQLSNYTRLRWKAPKNGNAAGYYVLVRETSAPTWQTKIYVEGTEATLPYSKDNYFFAVQAVSAQGHESLPAWPIPFRK